MDGEHWVVFPNDTVDIRGWNTIGDYWTDYNHRLGESISIDGEGEWVSIGKYEHHSANFAPSGGIRPNAFNVDNITYIGGASTTVAGSNSDIDTGMSNVWTYYIVQSMVVKGNISVGGIVQGTGLCIGTNDDSSTSNKSIFFGGTKSDNSYQLTVIENRVYETEEKAELLLFKGDDNADASGGGTYGPDRIRLKAGQIAFDLNTGTTDVEGVFSADRSSEDIRCVMHRNAGGAGMLGINVSSPTECVHVDGKIKCTLGFVGRGKELTGLDFDYINNNNVVKFGLNGVTQSPTKWGTSSVGSEIAYPTVTLLSNSYSGYTVTASRDVANAYYVFEGPIPRPWYGRWQIGDNTVYSNGVNRGGYIGSTERIAGYKGEWIELQMPDKIYLTRLDVNSDYFYTPRITHVFGSNDGIEYDLIHYSGDLGYLWTSNNGNKTIFTRTPDYIKDEPYNRILIIVNMISGGNQMYWDQVDIYGTISTFTPKVYIDNSGKIGIVNTNPSYPLDVTGDINLTGDLRKNGVIHTFGGGGSSVWSNIYPNAYYNNGNVGIGTTNPSYPLDVTGDINVTGALYANGSTGSSGQVLTSSGGGIMNWTTGVNIAKDAYSVLVSKGLTGSQGYTMNTVVPTKDMNVKTTTREIPAGYSPSSVNLTPTGNRYVWQDLGGDIFDNWGDFYIYNPLTDSATNISFANINGLDEIVYTETQTHHGKSFTIKHGWVTQGIFKLDVECSDITFEFSIGMYGDMGFDGSGQVIDRQYSATWGTLSYNYSSQSDTGEWFYSHCIPKIKTFNDGITLSGSDFTSNFKTDEYFTNLALWTETLVLGATFYFVKGSNNSTGAMYDWVENDIEIDALEYKLDVDGTMNLTSGLRVNSSFGTYGQVLTSSGGGTMTWTTPSSFNGDIADYITHTGDSDAKFGFPTTDTFTITLANIERFRINSSGEAMFGSSSGQTMGTGHKMTVIDGSTSNDGSYADLVITNQSEHNKARILLGTPYNQDANSAFKAAIIADGVGSSSRCNLHFCLENTTSNTPNADITDSKMVIKYDTGNVGIGTTSPGYKLDVNGDINLTGGLRANGAAGTSGQVLTSSGGGAMSWTNKFWSYATAASHPTVTMTSASSGGYVASASSSLGSSPAYHAFNNVIGAESWSDQNWLYIGSPTGTYTGSFSTTYNGSTTVDGEWIQLQVPTSIIIHSIKIAPENFRSLHCPTEGKILGSTNGSTWTLIHSFTGQTYTDGQYTTISFSNSVSYSYFRLCVERTGGGRSPGPGSLRIGELKFNEASTTDIYYNSGNIGIGTVMPVHPLDVVGNINCTGTLSKGSGSFKIDHPLAIMSNTHCLYHSFIEGPQADLIYRGKVDLVNGSASINLDTVSKMTSGTFEALNRNVQCFTSNESDWDAVKGSVSGNTLTISCQNASSTSNVSWLVIGERKDKHMYDTSWTDDDGFVIPEQLK